MGGGSSRGRLNTIDRGALIIEMVDNIVYKSKWESIGKSIRGKNISESNEVHAKVYFIFAFIQDFARS